MKDDVYSWLHWLHSAENVWKFQSWFGVDESLRKKCKNNSSSPHVHENGLNSTTAKNVCNGFAKESECKISAQASTSAQMWTTLCYYFFKIGSFLGQEEFYVVFFPFWFWHFDAPTGRKSMFAWMLCMHIGQVAKDFFRWHRPKSPPVIHLENTFLSEYGMPSTHATVAICIPFCITYFHKDVCQMSSVTCCIFVLSWCTWVSLSRIYMGVHTYLEILVGLSISAMVTALLTPIIDRLDEIFMQTFAAPVILLIFSFALSFAYPNNNRTFTRSWSDAIAILSSTAGILCGSWLECRFLKPAFSPFCIFSARFHLFPLIFVLAKTVVGVFVILSAKILAQNSYDFFWKRLFAITKDNLSENYLVYFLVTRKFCAYLSVGFCVFLTPTFLYLGQQIL